MKAMSICRKKKKGREKQSPAGDRVTAHQGFAGDQGCIQGYHQAGSLKENILCQELFVLKVYYLSFVVVGLQ